MPSTPSLEPLATPPAAAPVARPVRDCPYVGPNPFSPEDRAFFYGRDREALDLKYRVLAHPITLLYAMSGAGKTSLINAKLIPELQREGCRVLLPVARVRGTTGKVNPSEIPNIFAFHALMSWQTESDPEIHERVKGLTLKTELARLAGGAQEDEDGTLLVAIFDQFEELFTTTSSRWSDRRGFFRELSAALIAVPRLRILLAMREDFLASMDPFADLVPEKLRTRFRLERLRREAALEAVVRPLAGTGRSFAPGVADQLVDSLMRIHVRPQREAREVRAGKTENVDNDLLSGVDLLNTSQDSPVVSPESEEQFATAEYVEPVQLQVVCQDLWKHLEEGEREITSVRLASCGDVNQALSKFYEDCVHKAADAAALSEGVVRRWFDQQLITQAGTRGIAFRKSQHTGGLPNAAVDVLEASHLIRGEDRGGARWYELSHDRFIEPIQQSNLLWMSSRPGQLIAQVLEKRAEEWESAPGSEKASLLLDETDLNKAEAWAASEGAAEIGPSDKLRGFLDASRAVVFKAQVAARTRRQWVLTAAVCTQCLLLMFALLNAVRANYAMNQAAISELALRGSIEAKPVTKVHFIREAIDKAKMKMGGRLENRTADLVRNNLARVYQRGVLGSHQAEVTEVAFAPPRWRDRLAPALRAKGPMIAVGDNAGVVQLWSMGDINDPLDDKPLATVELPPDRPGRPAPAVSRIAFDPADARLAVATGDTINDDPGNTGGAWVWSLPGLSDRSDPPLTPLAGHTGPVADIAFSHDGTRVATAASEPLGAALDHDKLGAWSGKVRVFNATTGAAVDQRAFPLRGPGRSVAFDRHDRKIVAAGGDINRSHLKLPGEAVVFLLDGGTPVPMKGHEYATAAAAFSPDGSLVVSGGVDGIGRVHDAETGELLARLVGHSQQISALAFSHDGSRLVTSSYDRSARIWEADSWLSRDRSGSRDVPQWVCQSKLVGHKSALIGAEFSPDGTMILTCSYDGTARVWDVQTGESLSSFQGHEGPVYRARFSYYGFLVATAGGDHTARVWTTGQVETPLLLLAGHTAALRKVAFSPLSEGHLALTVGADGVACLHDVPRISSPGMIHPPLKTLTPNAPRSALTDGAFCPPEGALAATSGQDGVVRIWNTVTAKELVALVPEPGTTAGAALDVTFSPKGRYLLTSWADGRMRLFRRDGERWSQVKSWAGSALRLGPQLFDANETFVVTPNSGLLRVKASKGSVRVWDADHPGTPGLPLEGLDGPVADLATHPDGTAIAAATLGLSPAVHFWNERGHPLGPALRHPAGVERVVFSPTGDALATEAEDGLGRVWSWPFPARQTPEPATLTGLTGPAPNLAFSDDGKRVLTDSGYLGSDFLSTALASGLSRVWRRDGGKPVDLIGPRDTLLALAFSRADPGVVLTVNRENRLQRWDAANGEPRGVCRGANVAPTAVAIRPDGRSVASGTADGSLLLWSAKSGRLVSRLNGHTDRITRVSFSRDGRKLVSASVDGTARVWSADDEGQVDRQAIATFKQADSLPLTAARFLDAEGRKVVTGTGDLGRYFWKPEASSRQGIACRVRLDDLAKEPEPLLTIGPLDRGSSADDLPLGVIATAVSPLDGQTYLACGGTKSTEQVVWTCGSAPGTKVHPLRPCHNEVILDVAVSPDGTRLATSSVDNTARVWDLPIKPGSRMVQLQGHSGDVTLVAFSPARDGPAGGPKTSNFVLTICRQDGTARIWDVDGGDPLYVLGTRKAGFNSATLDEPAGPRRYTDDVTSAAFSRDGKLLITGHGDGMARVYSLDLCGDFQDLSDVAARRAASLGLKAQNAATPGTGP